MTSKQPSLARLRRFQVQPKHALGQNFLIDSNILKPITQAAQISDEDVVLEVGGGLGVLSEYLAARSKHVHVVEVDHSLEPALQDALDSFTNVTVHYEDAAKLVLEKLSPAPTKLVANLPYGVAATVLIRVLQQLPSVRCQVAMVQREVGERFSSKPGSRQYGVSSVLAQLVSDVKIVRPVARTVFYPVPNVDSVIVSFLRKPAVLLSKELTAFVRAAFAHRRKTLIRSLTLAGVQVDKQRFASVIETLGHRLDIRGEMLTPEQFSSLHQQLFA